MKELQKQFEGRGEVNGFKFTQIYASNCGFIYLKEGRGSKTYEVFKRRENTYYGNVSYPTSKAFGTWAWEYNTIEQAQSKMNQIHMDYIVKLEK